MEKKEITKAIGLKRKGIKEMWWRKEGFKRMDGEEKG